MNSIKELKEQLGYEEIGLDDTFTFRRCEFFSVNSDLL